MAANLVIVGAGGHARSTVDVVESSGTHQIDCLYDPVVSEPGDVFGYPVYSADSSLAELIRRQSCEVFIAVGDNFQRQRIQHEIAATIKQVRFATLIHKQSSISPRASVGEGCVVMAGATINAGCVLGSGVVVNTNASVDHDCVIKDFASLAPGVVLGGNVSIGERTSVGLGAQSIHRVNVARDVVIGAGSLLLSNIEQELSVAYGRPARVVRQRTADELYL